MLTTQQQYWTLNGNFEALHRMIDVISSGEISNLSEMKDQLVFNLKLVNERMNEIEEAAKIVH